MCSLTSNVYIYTHFGLSLALCPYHYNTKQDNIRLMAVTTISDQEALQEATHILCAK